MVQYYSNKIDPQDKKVIRLFKELGMPKNLVKTLLYISQINECRSIDIEQEANLRQPEVSIATQQLLEKGWIKKRNLRKKGKGRPTIIFRLAYSLDKILIKIEQEKIKEIENIKKDLSVLKTLIEDR